MAMLLRRIITAGAQKSNIPVRYYVGKPAESGTNLKIASAAEPNLATNQTINLSDSCVKRLQEICKDGSFLRVTVEGGGCSGFQYKFELDSKMCEDDLTFGPENAKVVTDTTSIEYCDGATVDYHTELIRSGFRMLANPKAEQGCSCGASFALKLD